MAAEYGRPSPRSLQTAKMNTPIHPPNRLVGRCTHTVHCAAIFEDGTERCSRPRSSYIEDLILDAVIDAEVEKGHYARH